MPKTLSSTPLPISCCLNNVGKVNIHVAKFSRRLDLTCLPSLLVVNQRITGSRASPADRFEGSGRLGVYCLYGILKSVERCLFLIRRHRLTVHQIPIIYEDFTHPSRACYDTCLRRLSTPLPSSILEQRRLG